MIDRQSFNTNLRVSWIKRLVSNLDDDWQIYYYSIFKVMAVKDS
jgi:ferritin-like protein